MTLLADATVKSALDGRHDLFITITCSTLTTIVYLSKFGRFTKLIVFDEIK